MLNERKGKRFHKLPIDDEDMESDHKEQRRRRIKEKLVNKNHQGDDDD